MFILLLVFLFALFEQFSTLGWPPTQHTFYVLGFLFLALFISFILCVSVPNLHNFFSVSTLDCLIIVVHSFVLQWLPHFTLLGMSAHQTFGLCLHFLRFPPWLVMIWPTLSLRLQILRLNFAHTMRRNRTSGSAPSRPNSLRQGSDHKNSSTPML